MEYIVLGLLGLCMGSFAGASVWRLRARQLLQDKAEGESVDKAEYARLKPLVDTKISEDRSRCLHCHHVLAWYDLLPLFSWLVTAGRCRYCHRPIGVFEPLIELGTALLFVGSFAMWPWPLTGAGPWALFALWLVSCVPLVILFAYDVKWFLLPNQAMFPLLVAGGIFAGLQLVINRGSVFSTIGAIGLSAAILSGLYLLLWIVSKGRWIGLGDVKLGFALALFLADWRLAFLTLLLANGIGCLLVLPGLVTHKITRSSHVPFGPLFIAGFLIALFFGPHILAWYQQILI